MSAETVLPDNKLEKWQGKKQLFGTFMIYLGTYFKLSFFYQYFKALDWLLGRKEPIGNRQWQNFRFNRIQVLKTNYLCIFLTQLSLERECYQRPLFNFNPFYIWYVPLLQSKILQEFQLEFRSQKQLASPLVFKGQVPQGQLALITWNFLSD